MQLIDVAARVAVLQWLRGVALACGCRKFRLRDGTARRTGTGGTAGCPEESPQEGRVVAALWRTQRKDASQLRKLQLCSRLLRAHCSRKSIKTGSGCLRGWRRTAVAETPGVYMYAGSVCSADALDCHRFTVRWFE